MDDNNEPLTKEKKIRCWAAGALAGALIGGIVFFIPETTLEEGVRLTAAVLLILLAPKFFDERLKLPFVQARFGMAAMIVISVAVYIIRGNLI